MKCRCAFAVAEFIPLCPLDTLRFPLSWGGNRRRQSGSATRRSIRLKRLTASDGGLQEYIWADMIDWQDKSQTPFGFRGELDSVFRMDLAYYG